MRRIRSAKFSSINHREDQIADSIASFVLKNNLIYGTAVRSCSNPVSWSIALEPLYINSKIWNALKNATTEIEVFIRRSVKATNPKNHIPQKVYPVCIRPDFVIDGRGNIKLIEMNIDRRLDRGIASGVHKYSVHAGILPINRMLDLFSCYKEFINSSKKNLLY